MSRNTRQQYARCVATLCLELAAYRAGPGVVDAGQFGGPGPVLLGPPGPVAFLSPATHVSSAQTTFAVRCWPVAYQPHLLLNASTSSKPRPPAVSPPGSARRGGCGLTRRLIETIYQPKERPPGEQPTNYARTLLILALAAAGIGDVDEAAAVGSAALECGRMVWPTMVLATRLDRFLAATTSDIAGAKEYRARFAEARQRLALPASRTDAGKSAR